MTQRKKIATAYVFAVPIVLAMVILQHGAFSRVVGEAGGMSQTAEVLQDLDTASSLLKEAETNSQRAMAADDVYTKMYQSNILQLRKVIQNLHDLSNRGGSSPLLMGTLEPLVGQRIGMFQELIDLNSKGTSRVPDRTALVAQSQKVSDEIGKAIANIKSAQLALLQRQRETTGSSVHTADAITTVGGALIIWFVGIAAFLLFYDEKKSSWDGVERRVHTIVLQSLPLGVCMTNDTGMILYANPAEEAVFGYEPGGLVGKNVISMHADGDGSAGSRSLSEILEQLESTQGWSGEISILKRDGKSLKTFAWISNMLVPGKGKEIPAKLFRVLVHFDYPR